MDEQSLGNEALVIEPGQQTLPTESSFNIPADLFPLPLTPFEQYVLLDDLPAQPMTAFVQLTFAGALESVRLEEALYQAVHRNPLLASRIRTDSKVWQWVYDASFRPSLESYEHRPPTHGGRVVPLDLRARPGVRVWHHPYSDGRWRLLFQFHHACADGIGMRRFVLDALAHYANSAVEAAVEEDGPRQNSSTVQHVRFERLDHLQLRSRGCLKHLTDTPPLVRLSTWQKIKNSYYFFFQPPAPLLGARLSPIEPTVHADPEPVLSRILSLEESQAICRQAQEREVGLNELGLAILFRQCRAWQAQHGLAKPKRRIRLLMPFDIRTKDDLRLTAANRLSFAFLGRTHQQCEDWCSLLASIQAETKKIKDTRVYVDFLQGLALCQTKPRLFKWLLARCQHMATAVFTYGGDIHRGLSRTFKEEDGRLRVGDVLWEDVLAAPPSRSNTNIALGLCISRGRICISASWNREALTADEAKLFFDGYVDAWRGLVLQHIVGHQP